MEMWVHLNGEHLVDGKALDALVRSLCGEHLASQMTRVSLGERTLLSPHLCKQCRERNLDGIFRVLGTDGESHCEPLCNRCAFAVVPHRMVFGVRSVQLVTLLIGVTREASDWRLM